MKSWPNVATKQLQSRKKVQQKYRDTACRSNFFPFYLTQASKIYVATSHCVVRLETIEISEQRTAFLWIFAQEVDWCIKDCDKERLQTTAFTTLAKKIGTAARQRAQVRDLSSMHAPVVWRAAVSIFFGQGRRLKNLPWLYWRLIWHQNLLRHVPLSSGMLWKVSFWTVSKLRWLPHPIIVSLDTLSHSWFLPS